MLFLFHKIATLEKKFHRKSDILRSVVMKMLSDEILDYIEENLKENLTLVDLSRQFHYSPRQLYYYLYEITGMPIMAYIRRRKLVNAAQEIALGRKMYDVAIDYGFETQAGFYKAFLQCIGCTPSEFQNHHKLQQLKQIGTKILSIREELNEMNEIEIRKMTLNDTKSLWENIFSGNTPEEVKERVQKNVAEMDAGNCVALVAAIDENIIGTVLIEKSQYIYYSNRCELCDMVVNPAFRSKASPQNYALKVSVMQNRSAVTMFSHPAAMMVQNTFIRRWKWRNAAGYPAAFWNHGAIKRYLMS